MPRRRIEYHGRTLEEFDLDAALERKPKLIVVDELAHTNAPDSRHPKRWQDVQELLDAGVNVWTALNIQHLESLADVVSRITGVAVRETVPDRVLQEAADVVLVDLTPDELIQRLNEGKVYVPETARRATQNFFTPGNLTALRELALRRTADRVDDQMVDYLREKAIEGPWAASERLLACVGADEVSERVIRRASQLATGLNADWIAVTVETIGQAGDAKRANRLAKVFGLAERLGGQTMRLQGSDYPSDILRLAARENVTQIVLGQSRAGLLRRILGRSLPEALMRGAGGIEIHIVPGEEARPSLWPRLKPLLSRRGLGPELAVALVSVAAAVAVAEALSAVLQLPNLSMIFLTAVLFCAVRFGTRAAVLASLASFAAYNFFFIEPIYTFTVAQPQELFALLIFLAVAVLTGSLTGRIRDQREMVIGNAEVTQSLYDYSRKLSGASRPDDVLWAAAAHLHATFGGRIVLLVAEGDELQIRAAWPPDAQLDAAALGAANWAQQKKEPAGWGTGTLPRIAYQFRPLLAARGSIAVCGFEPHSADEPITAEDERALTAILDLTAIALDRALLAREAVNAATMQENEKVRDALLDSLSHDLRTPLSSIAGAATLAARAWRQDEPGRTSRTPVVDRRGDRAARALRRQSAGHVADRSGRAQGQSRSGLHRRCRAGRGRAQPQGVPGRAGAGQPRARPAFRARRRQAARAGFVQPARQRAQIRGRRWRDRSRPPGGRRDRAQRHRRGSRHQAGGARTHLREVLSRRAP